MIQGLRKRMEAQINKVQENFNTDLEELKNKQREMNMTMAEMKSTLERISSRITGTEEQNSNLEDRMLKISVTDRNKNEKKRRQFKRLLK